MSSQISEPCILCGQPSSDDAHIIRRSQGGEETVRMCRTCHRQYDLREFYVADAERGWWQPPGGGAEAPSIAPGFLQVYDREGQVLAIRPLNPTKAGLAYGYLRTAGESLDEADRAADTVDDDDLVLVHELFRNFEGKAVGATRRRLIDAVLRMPRGSLRQKVTSVAQTYDVGITTVHRALEYGNLTGLLVRELPDFMPEEVAARVLELPWRLVEAIGNDADPVDAAQHVLAQRQADPNYGTPQFLKEREQRTEYMRCTARYDPETGKIEHGECAMAKLTER